MKVRIDRNTRTQLAGIVLVVVGVVLSAAGRSDSGLGLAGVLVVVLGLIGVDRIRSLKAFGGEVTLDDVKQAAEDRVKTPPSVTTEAVAQAGAFMSSDLTFSGALKAERTRSVTADAVIAGIRSASTPAEVVDQVAGYAALRSVPGLRGLSEDRIRLEQGLYGAILRLQTRRHSGAKTTEPGALATVLRDIERFWRQPELLSDEAVANLTDTIDGVIATMKA